jgi:hypothetical protein
MSQLERQKTSLEVLWGQELLVFPGITKEQRDAHELAQENNTAPTIVSLDPKLLSHAINALGRFSRTFQGIGSKEVSDLKLDMLLSGDALTSQVQENFKVGTNFLFQALAFGLFHKFDRGLVVLGGAQTLFNNNIVKPEQGPFRTWETPYGHVPVQAIIPELSAFCRLFAQVLHTPGLDPKMVGAWIEHDLNGRIHPYSDGCGRMSRGLSTAYLGLYDIPRPVFANRDEYIEKFKGSFEEWSTYFASSIPETPNLAI